MSNFAYCDCGAKTAQIGIVAKFCSSCGQPFIKTETAKTVPPPPSYHKSFKKGKIEIDPEDDEIEDEDIEEIDEETRAQIRQNVDLSNNPFSVEVSRPQKLKISDIARGNGKKKPAPVNQMNIREQTKTKQSKKEFLKEWQAEAGTSRKNK